MDKDDRYTRITLRIPKDLHEQLSEAADLTSKSMNAEIVARLQSTFLDAEKPDLKALENQLNLTRMLALSNEQSLSSAILTLASVIQAAPGSTAEARLNQIKGEAEAKLINLEDFDAQMRGLIDRLHITDKKSKKTKT